MNVTLLVSQTCLVSHFCRSSTYKRFDLSNWLTFPFIVWWFPLFAIHYSSPLFIYHIEPDIKLSFFSFYSLHTNTWHGKNFTSGFAYKAGLTITSTLDTSVPKNVFEFWPACQPVFYISAPLFNFPGFLSLLCTFSTNCPYLSKAEQLFSYFSNPWCQGLTFHSRILLKIFLRLFSQEGILRHVFNFSPAPLPKHIVN